MGPGKPFAQLAQHGIPLDARSSVSASSIKSSRPRHFLPNCSFSSRISLIRRFRNFSEDIFVECLELTCGILVAARCPYFSN